MKYSNFCKYTAALLLMAHVNVHGVEENIAEALPSQTTIGNLQISATSSVNEALSQVTGNTQFSKLPQDSLSNIILFLKSKDIARMAQSSQFFRDLIYTDENLLSMDTSRILDLKLSQLDDRYFKYYIQLIKFNPTLIIRDRFNENFGSIFNAYVSKQSKPVLFQSSFALSEQLPESRIFDKTSWVDPLAFAHYKASHGICYKVPENERLEKFIHQQSDLYKNASVIRRETSFISFVSLTLEEWNQNVYHLTSRLPEYFSRESNSSLLVDMTAHYSELNNITSSLGIKKVAFSNINNMTSIGDYFLYTNHDVQSIDLSGLNNVTSIGNGFLSQCSSLTSIDLSGLRNATSIGDYFLGGCSGLQSIDLSVLRNVTSIGDGFLSECSGLDQATLHKAMENGVIHNRLLESHPNINITWID